MPRLGLPFFCALLAFLSLDQARATVTETKAQDPVWELGRFAGQLDSLLRQSKSAPGPSDAFVFLSEIFMGTPYQEHTLIGSETEPERLVINLAGVDCFTFLDYVAALSMCDSSADLVEKVRKIRYGKPDADYASRNHFFVQWIENNAEWLNGRIFPDSVTRCEPKQLNRKKDGSLWLAGIPVVEKTICYLPRKGIDAKQLRSLQSGDVVGLVTSLPGLDVTHVGLILRQNDKTLLRHASSKMRKVVDQDLLEYIAQNKNVAGLIAARPIKR